MAPMERMADSQTNGHLTDEYDGSAIGQRPSWLEVDLDAIASNVRTIRALVGPATRVCAVVKAEAYGLGAIETARAAVRGGADMLAVARAAEGARLRRAGIMDPIFLIAGFVPSEAQEIVRFGLTPTVVRVEDAETLARAAAADGVTLPVHLKVDTGLTRYGAAPNTALQVAGVVRALDSLDLDGVYTHFASSDERDPAFTRLQLERLGSFVTRLRADGHRPRIVHAANSAATLALPESRLDMVRVGITLGGPYPSADVAATTPLTPAVALRARVLGVYDLPVGATVGYGRSYRAERPVRAALVPTGYADGVPRAHEGRATALLHGRRVSLIGRVSMDQCVVDVSDVPRARVGDVVTLFGPDAEGEIPLEEFAGWSDTIGHEALCRVGSRVPRLYREDGKSRWAGVTTSDHALPEASFSLP